MVINKRPSIHPSIHPVSSYFLPGNDNSVEGILALLRYSFTNSYQQPPLHNFSETPILVSSVAIKLFTVFFFFFFCFFFFFLSAVNQYRLSRNRCFFSHEHFSRIVLTTQMTNKIHKLMVLIKILVTFHNKSSFRLV